MSIGIETTCQSARGSSRAWAVIGSSRPTEGQSVFYIMRCPTAISYLQSTRPCPRGELAGSTSTLTVAELLRNLRSAGADFLGQLLEALESDPPDRPGDAHRARRLSAEIKNGS